MLLSLLYHLLLTISFPFIPQLHMLLFQKFMCDDVSVHFHFLDLIVSTKLIPQCSTTGSSITHTFYKHISRVSFKNKHISFQSRYSSDGSHNPVGSSRIRRRKMWRGPSCTSTVHVDAMEGWAWPESQVRCENCKRVSATAWVQRGVVHIRFHTI